MRISKLLLASSVFALICTEAYAQPGFPTAIVQQPVTKNDCAVWVESSQNTLMSAPCSGVASGVSSFNTRTGTVVLQGSDVTGVGGLLNTNNLSDVSSAATARANLGANSATNLTTGTIPSARIVALPNANLANSSMTLAGHLVNLGDTQTIASTDLSDTALLARLASPTFTGTVNAAALTLSGALTTNITGGGTQCVQASNTGVLSGTGGGCGGSGGVTSVGQSFTGGLISVSGSPITTSGTLALTVAGTSGGIPYFSSSSAWASSAALAANSLVIGGGAGVAPSTVTTGSGVLTALGIAHDTSGGICTVGGGGCTGSGALTVTDGTNTVTSTTTITTGAGLVVGGSAGSATLNNTQLINPQTGTTYTLLNTDVGVLVTMNNGSAIALTVPQAGTTGFENGKSFLLANIGAGLVTATTSGSTIKGAGGGVSFTLPQNTQCWLNSDGSNWIVDGCTAYLNGSAIKTGTVLPANGGTGINSLGTGIATFLGTPSSANFAAALTDETGTGSAVFAGSPTFTGTVTAAAETLTGTLTTNLTGGGTQCVQASNTGVISGTGSACGAGGSGSGTFNYSDNGLTLTAGTYFAPIGGGGANSATEASVSLKASSAFTIANLQTQLSADPGAGQTVVYTLRKGGVDTALTCTTTGGSGAVCQDLNAGHSVSVAQNDLIDWKIATTGTVVGTFNVNIMANSGATPGGVTSVAMTVPSRQAVSGSPITASGTLAITDNNQNANLVFAGPASGSAAAPTFRSLANADVPFVSTVNSYVTGSYYPLFASEGTQNYNCNSVTTICWTTYIADQSFTISEIGGLVTTLSGGGNFQLAVYNVNAGNTAASGAALCSTASMSTAATGPLTSACAASFVKNTTYLIGVMFDNTVAKLSAPGSATLANSMRLGNPTLANIAAGTTWGTIVTTTGQTFGTWPTSPALTFAQNNTPRTVLPIIKINTIP